MEQMDDRNQPRQRDGASVAGAGEPSPLAQAAFSAVPPDVAGELTTEVSSESHETYLARRRRERDAAIDGLLAGATERGQPSSRAFWAMVYDFEMAPMTTNRAQLWLMGIAAPPVAELTDDALATKLLEVVNGLARLSIYLNNTNHLTDRALYERLVGDVLDEDIRDIAGAPDVQEWIDMNLDDTTGSSPVVCDRDDRLPRPEPRGRHET